MSKIIESCAVYSKDRLTFFPWLIMPLLIIAISHGDERIRYILLYPLLWGVLFFRVFDDLCCFNYDLKLNKLHTKLGIKPLLLLSYFLGLIYLSSLLFIFDPQILILNIALLTVSGILYYVFRQHKLITTISLLKYPVLMYMVAIFTNESNYLWSILGCTFFFLREYFEEFKGLRNKRFEIIFILGLIINKYLLRFL